MLEDICAYIHNYFHGWSQTGTFEITSGTLFISGLADGQYFQICGSRFNDGIYTYPAFGLADEVFDGTIWEMRPPRRFLRIVEEIETWQAQFGNAANSPYQSESFGGYSYTLKSGSTASGTSDAVAGSWQGVFRDRLKQWRKLA